MSKCNEDHIADWVRDGKPFAEELSQLVTYDYEREYSPMISMMRLMMPFPQSEFLYTPCHRVTNFDKIEEEFVNMYVRKLEHDNYSTFNERERLEAFARFLSAREQQFVVDELHKKAREIYNEKRKVTLTDNDIEKLVDSIQRDIDLEKSEKKQKLKKREKKSKKRC